MYTCMQATGEPVGVVLWKDNENGREWERVMIWVSGRAALEK
jgi:hypothetical protein